MTDYNYVGNISTVIKLMGMMFASMLGEVIGALIGLGFGYIDAKYPNSFKFLGNSDIIPDETIDDGEDYV